MSEPASPSNESPSTRNQPAPESPKPKDLLERSWVWFALGMMITGAVGILAFLQFVSTWVKSEVKSDEIVALIQQSASAGFFPKGALVLFSGSCPQAWEDVTPNFTDRYLYIDQNVTEYVRLYDDDSSHEHDGGSHRHNVTGKTAALGGGERHGGGDRHAAHMSNTAAVTGEAHPEEPTHSHVGGRHQHRRAGLRLCKV